MAYQQARFGDGIAFAKTQRHWRVLPAPSPARRLWACLSLEPIAAVYRPKSPAHWAKRDAHALPHASLTFANPAFFLGAIALLVVGASRRVRVLNRFEVSLAAPLLLIPYVTRGPEMGMVAMGRFVAVAFPIYLVLGWALCRIPVVWAVAVLAASGALMAVYAALFVAGHAIL